MPRLDLPPRDKLLLAHDRLCRAYDCPIPYFHHLDPLSELVSSLLSHRTRNADSGRAFKSLRQMFPTWAAVRDAATAAVESAIAAATWPEQKAPRIQQVLRSIADRRGGDLSLDFLADLPAEQARAWLEELAGVGPKTSAAVLSFSALRGKALPVDSHHHRVAVRLAVIPAGLTVGPSHKVMEAMLPPDWDAQQVYDHHEVLMLHGQRCCYHAAPACHRCQVLDLCPFGQARIGGGGGGNGVGGTEARSPDAGRAASAGDEPKRAEKVAPEARPAPPQSVKRKEKRKESWSDGPTLFD